MFSGDSPSRPATFFFFFPPSLHYRFRSIVRNDGQGPGCVGKWILHGAGSYSISGRQREDLITKKHSSTTVPTTWIRVSNRLQLAILGTKRYPMFDATATATHAVTPRWAGTTGPYGIAGLKVAAHKSSTGLQRLSVKTDRPPVLFPALVLWSGTSANTVIFHVGSAVGFHVAEGDVCDQRIWRARDRGPLHLINRYSWRRLARHGES